MWIWLLFLSTCLATLPAGSLTAMATTPKEATDQAVGTTVTSQKMTFKNQESQAVFDGSVVLTRGALVVYSDRMVVTFSQQDPAGESLKRPTDAGNASASTKGPDTVANRAVTQIEAIGRVKIERESGNATCQKAVYYRNEDKIVLTGDPIAWDKGTRVSGKRITMFLAEDRTVVEGGSHVRIEPDGGTR